MATADSSKPRLLTGDRPTGSLHLGHLVGSLRQRVALQDDYECFNILADLHTLTTRPKAEQIRGLPQSVREMVIDLLSVGIDPERTVIYLQSGVPAVYDLAILLQMLVPSERLQQLESVKDMAEAAGQSNAMSLGLLAYPVLQAADILMAQARVIPVGGDNVAHVEIACELAGRFNELYGALFALPEARVSRTPMLPGIDPGDDETLKMSKSRGNAIWLRDDSETVHAKLANLGGARLRAFVDAFIDDEARRRELLASMDDQSASESAIRGEVESAIESILTPIRSRRDEISAERGRVEEIVVDGTIRAREVAYTTLARVRELMGLEGLWQGLVAATEARAEARKAPY